MKREPGRDRGRAGKLIAEAVEGGARLVVLPELFNTGYEFHERNYALADVPLYRESVCRQWGIEEKVIIR